MIIDLVHELFEKIEDYERTWLEKKTKSSLHIARSTSLITLATVTYILTFLISITVSSILERVYPNNIANYEYLSSIALLIVLPISIPLVSNWANRDFCLSTIFVEIIEVISYTKIKLTSLRTIIEISMFVSYVLVNLFLSIFAIANFINEQVLTSFIESHKIELYSTISVVHAVIYISIRILLLSEGSLMQKHTKKVREFRLWVYVLLFTFCYMFYKLFTSFSSVDVVYLLGALLVSIVRFQSSYKELRKSIVKLKEKVAFEL